jgi:hypothetical protein
VSTPSKRDAATVTELAAARADMTGAIARHIEYLVDAYAMADQPLSVTEASTRARAPLSQAMTQQEPENVTWHTLGNLMEHDRDNGLALWESIKAAARQELQTGTRAAKAVERSLVTSDPYERAQFLVVLESLTASLRPQGGAEGLLVQQMAMAFEQMLRWQTIVTQRVEQESWAGERDRRRILENMSKRQREREEYETGWMPPRVSDVEAIDQAVIIADRAQRSFLRLLRTLQMMRTRIGTVVMTGGQLNVAEQQVVLPAAGDPVKAE